MEGEREGGRAGERRNIHVGREEKENKQVNDSTQ